MCKDFKTNEANVRTALEFSSGLSCLPQDAKERLKGTDFIDGGSFTGDSVLFMMNYGPRRVYAFEPSRINLKQLKNNIAKYGWSDRVTPVEMGLSDSYQMAHMSDGGGAGSKIVQDKNAPTISLTDIDTYVEKHDLCPGLIKLDLEGIESTIIQGAKRTIQKFKPILLISIYHNPRDFFEIKPYLESLGAGYAYMIRKTPYTLYADTVLICF